MTQANKNNLLYKAREFDFDISLQFNRMRYYNPNLGKFIAKDKLFSQNYFLYSFNNPTKQTECIAQCIEATNGVCMPPSNEENSQK